MPYVFLWQSRYSIFFFTYFTRTILLSAAEMIVRSKSNPSLLSIGNDGLSSPAPNSIGASFETLTSSNYGSTLSITSQGSMKKPKKKGVFSVSLSFFMIYFCLENTLGFKSKRDICRWNLTKLGNTSANMSNFWNVAQWFTSLTIVLHKKVCRKNVPANISACWSILRQHLSFCWMLLRLAISYDNTGITQWYALTLYIECRPTSLPSLAKLFTWKKWQEMSLLLGNVVITQQ